MPEIDYIFVSDDNPCTFQNLLDKLAEGWTKGPSNTSFGTEKTRIYQLLKFSDEEKAALEISPQLPIEEDENLLSVPILSYAEEQKGGDNPYKILAAQGWKEVHRTSKEAVMKKSRSPILKEIVEILFSNRTCEERIKDLQILLTPRIFEKAPEEKESEESKIP